MNLPKERGVSLIELLISMIIGLFLILAIGSVYLASKDTYRVSESVARLQENGRVALHILTEDLQMTGYLGNSMNPGFINGRAGSSDQLGPVSGDCAVRWHVDMSRLLVVGNDQEPQLNGTDFATTCLNQVNYHAGTDVIALKRAANAEINPTQLGSAAHQNWLLLRTDTVRGEFFIGGGPEPAGFTPAFSTNRRWLAHVYFIAYNAAAEPENRLPALRRLRLGGGPQFFNDRELVRGVQDMQIHFGIDTNGDGNANQFVEPGSEGLAPVVAARVWLLMRSEEPEAGHDDSVNTYVYANKRYIPGDSSTDNGTETAADPTRYRRLLLTKTIAFRNKW